jgi:hypothetical protein
MKFLMTKTQPPVSPFTSQPAVFARVGLPAPTIGAKAALRPRRHEKSIRGNLNPHHAFVSLIKHSTLPGCVHNLHSRDLVRLRGSPTRFIPSFFSDDPRLDCLQALG